MDPLSSSTPIPSAFLNFDPAAAEKKIVKFIRRAVQTSGASGVVLGLSGGIDSALAAVLAVKALGSENVFPIFFRAGGFNQDDLQDAAFLAEKLGLTLQEIDLSPVLLPAEAAAAEQLSAAEIGNLKSRLRMSLLYSRANKNNLLVIGTKNKTELMTGYFTKYGDGGVDIDPVADLYKTEIRLLSKYLELPESILMKTPSAGFWAGQSDENDFGMRYDQLDALLFAVERGKIKPGSERFKKVSKKIGLSQKQSQSIAARLSAAEHKQKMPPIPKIKRTE
ncbi:MAG: NAD+ synthase [Methanosarcinales archaeon]|jgi:NAD+ synthase|nr:NAD+ synthase [Methanosarcinales archaeon]